tara:strand:+ start:19209 stop:21236 length:2028 start_codon:yes stop_codon:yes gene_type:complete
LETATLLLIIAALFIALFIAGFQYLFKNKEKSQLMYWLFFFRFLSIFSIVLLLINPSVKKQSIEIIKPKLLVAVDNSTSIKYNSQEIYVKNIVNFIKEEKDLNAKFDINYFGFGNSLFILDSLKFNQNQTNLSIPFKEFSSIYKTENNPVLLITDGNQNVGTNVEFVDYNSPVFPLIIGDTTSFEDIYIRQINTNNLAYIHNKLPVEVFINYEGNKQVIKNLNIYQNSKKVYSKQLSFSKGTNVKTESFFLKSDSKGTQFYTAKIETLKNEKNTINNVKTFTVDVIEEQSKILILTSILHPDLGMFKKSIESNKQRSVSIETTFKFKGELDDYQLIIIYQPTNLFKQVFNDLKEKNLNYFIVTGTATDWQFLNKNQTNFNKLSIDVFEKYHAIFNPNYATFINNDIGFSSFPPLEDLFGDVTFNIPFNTLLYQKIGTVETNKPLLVTFEKNNRKGALLLGENLWRWRMNSFSENKSFELFDGFVSNLIQYLSSTRTNKRLNIAIDPIYYANETVNVFANYLDKNLNFDTRAKLWFTISNKENNFLKKIPFAILQSKFAIELSNIPNGEYEYTVSVENQTTTVSGSFKILPFEVEQQFANANEKALKIVVAKTNGDIFYANQDAELIENLKADPRFKSIQKTTTVKTPLIDWKWILGLILFLLSVEWFTRKYFGKI